MHENRALRLRGDLSTAGQYTDSDPLQQQHQSQFTASTSPAQQQHEQHKLPPHSPRLAGVAAVASASAAAALAAAGAPNGERVLGLGRDYFDEAGYIQRGILRSGEDPYTRNSFNQQASDALPSNRNIPDTRHQM